MHIGDGRTDVGTNTIIAPDGAAHANKQYSFLLFHVFTKKITELPPLNNGMEVKNLFEPAAKQEIAERIGKLSAQSPHAWGKMNVAQMLAHIQLPLSIALGETKIKSGFIMKLIFPLFKKQLWDSKPYKKGLPTHPAFIMTDEKVFETEKNKLLELLRRFEPSNMEALVHPVFGKMTLEQWGMSNWKHLDHHLQQFGV